MHVIESFKLEGKVAFVTGGGRGIGKTCALGLAEAGADVAVVDVDPDTRRAWRAGTGHKEVAQRRTKPLSSHVDLCVFSVDLDDGTLQAQRADGNCDTWRESGGWRQRGGGWRDIGCLLQTVHDVLDRRPCLRAGGSGLTGRDRGRGTPRGLF